MSQDASPLAEPETPSVSAAPAASAASAAHAVPTLPTVPPDPASKVDPTASTKPANGAELSPGSGRPAVANVANRIYRGARIAALDPRTLGILRAVPRAAGFLTQANRRSALAAQDDTVIPVRTTPGLAAQVLLDEVLIAMFRHPRLLPRNRDFPPAAADVAAAHAMFAERGWLEDPSSYHETPEAPDEVVRFRRQVAGMRYEHIAFPSLFEPHEGEPGRERWLSYEPNRTAHAWTSRVAPVRDSGSWLICVHGFGMGYSPLMDMRAFRVPQVNAQGVNVAMPVLPLHGPRAVGEARGEGLMTIDMVDSMHGLAQAAWDIRRLVAWLRREQGAKRIGLFGHSLGGQVVALTAALQEDLSCVIAGIPVVDLPDLYRRHSPPEVARRALTAKALGPDADAVHRVVSPVSMPCLVPHEGRYVFAGLGDRMATFGHARRLWLHWDRPALATYHGGHVGFYWSATVRRFVEKALKETGLAHANRDRDGAEAGDGSKTYETMPTVPRETTGQPAAEPGA